MQNFEIEKVYKLINRNIKMENGKHTTSEIWLNEKNLGCLKWIFENTRKMAEVKEDMQKIGWKNLIKNWTFTAENSGNIMWNIVLNL